MGKKKDKLKQEQLAVVPWELVDEDPLAFLVAPEVSSTFLEHVWERKPAVYKATPERTALFSGLATLPALVSLLHKREQPDGEGPLEFGLDVNAARYQDGRRETPNGQVANAVTLQRLHDKERCTLQVHQPQRFFDNVWRLLAALEAQIGCLVGSNAYLTPRGSQGLAPHHDDVEIFVVQTAGRKAWSLYSPLGGYYLPNKPSGDLPQGVLGDPVLEVVLEPGDVLYMPRGTIHQAVSQGDASSAHLTISTYQHSSWADLTQHLLSVGLMAQCEPDCLPLQMRRSPLPGFWLRQSLHRVLAAPSKDGPDPQASSQLAAALRELADSVEAQPDLLTAAAQSMVCDFLKHRLPPHPDQLQPQGAAPTLSDGLYLRGGVRWSYLMPMALPEGVADDGEGGTVCEREAGRCTEQGCPSRSQEHSNVLDGRTASKVGLGVGGAEAIKLVTALHNSREWHMIGGAVLGSESCEDEADSLDGDDEGDGDDQAGRHRRGSTVTGLRPSRQEQGQTGDGPDAEMHEEEEEEEEEESEVDDEDEMGRGVLSLPGVVFPPESLRALLQLMRADSKESAVPVAELALEHDADKLRVAFALWAEGIACTCAAPRQSKPVAATADEKPAPKKDAKGAEHGTGQGVGQQPAKEDPTGVRKGASRQQARGSNSRVVHSKRQEPGQAGTREAAPPASKRAKRGSK